MGKDYVVSMIQFVLRWSSCIWVEGKTNTPDTTIVTENERIPYIHWHRYENGIIVFELKEYTLR